VARKHMTQISITTRTEAISLFVQFGAKEAANRIGVSRSSLYRWKRRSSQGNLAPSPKIPKAKRQPTYGQEIVEYIRSLVKTSIRLGKRRIKVMLDGFCQKENLRPVSVTTVGEILKKYQLRASGEEQSTKATPTPSELEKMADEILNQNGPLPDYPFLTKKQLGVSRLKESCFGSGIEKISAGLSPFSGVIHAFNEA